MAPAQPELPFPDTRVAWGERFERAPWVSPVDGRTVQGWRCPDCGGVEVNGFVLRINHGYDPGVPGAEPRGGCFRLQRRPVEDVVDSL